MCRFIVCFNEILENLARVKSKLKKGTKVCAVVKANAYGFGLRKVCSLLQNSVDYFAVSRLEEFLEYKSYNFKKPCLILTPLSEKQMLIAVKNGAEVTISTNTNVAYIEKMAKILKLEVKAHIKVDTGMNRFGFKEDAQIINLLKNLKALEHIKIVGCYSHLHSAENKASSIKQNNRFKEIKNIFNKFNMNPIFHISNSYGANNKEYNYDMVRVGFDLYAGESHKLASKIIEVRQIKKGETIGYNASYKAKKNMLVAVCLGGYADGVRRDLSNRGKVLVGGVKCSIVGNICMDCFMVDITKTKNVSVGDEVVIFGKSGENYISVCEVAKWCDTITYEIYTGLSSRVKRVYRWRNYASYNREIQRTKTD